MRNVRSGAVLSRMFQLDPVSRADRQYSVAVAAAAVAAAVDAVVVAAVVAAVAAGFVRPPLRQTELPLVF